MYQSLCRYLLDRMVLRPSRHPLEHPTQRQRCCSRAPRPTVGVFLAAELRRRRAARIVGPEVSWNRGSSRAVLTVSDVDVGRAAGRDLDLEPTRLRRQWGRARLPGIADAAIEFWDQVHQRYPARPERVWLCANSLGCATALHVAASVQPDPRQSGMIMRNPPPLIPVVRHVTEQYPLSRWMRPDRRKPL